MEHRFVIFSENISYLSNIKQLFGTENISCVSALDDVTGAFMKDHINILIIDTDISEHSYMELLDKASFYPARVNFYSVTMVKGNFVCDGEIVSDPADYFKRKAG